ncbi:hypothetical protein P3L10_027982 [Capsicum annuum]
MKTSSGIILFSIAIAITFREGGENQSVRGIVEAYVASKADEYGYAVITEIYLRIYYDENVSSVEKNISIENLALLIEESINDDSVYEPIAVRMLSNRRGFIVADIETVLVETDIVQEELNRLKIENIHMPYAVGFLVVELGHAPSKKCVGSIESYFSEDYPVFLYDTFRKRSCKMLSDFFNRLAIVVRKNSSIHTIYFHNLSRFHGFLLLKYIASCNKKYRFNPFVRDRHIYEIVIYRDKKLLFRLRDSLKLLPG